MRARECGCGRWQRVARDLPHSAMAGKDERNGAYVVPAELKEFVRKRDQRKCLLCGASNTPPDCALIVAGSPWDEVEVSSSDRRVYGC